MTRRFVRFAPVLLFGLLLGAKADAQLPLGTVYEIYSNADGSVQFFQYFGGIATGDKLVAGNGVTEHSFTFASEITSLRALVGTQGFADLNLVKPDFVVPNGLLFVENGVITLGGQTFSYGTLPTNGWNAVWRDSEYGGWFEDTAIATNAARQTYAFTSGIGPGFTGAWYDPAQSGHGLFIEVLPDNRLFAGWFAFNPAGTEQAWFAGAGTYSGNTATISVVSLPTGGRWIPNFDPSQVVNNPWGTLTFTFADCNHGKVDFNSIAGYGTGSMNLTRLTQPAGLSCP